MDDTRPTVVLNLDGYYDLTIGRSHLGPLWLNVIAPVLDGDHSEDLADISADLLAVPRRSRGRLLFETEPKERPLLAASRVLPLPVTIPDQVVFDLVTQLGGWDTMLWKVQLADVDLRQRAGRPAQGRDRRAGRDRARSVEVDITFTGVQQRREADWKSGEGEVCPRCGSTNVRVTVQDVSDGLGPAGELAAAELVPVLRECLACRPETAPAHA